MSADGDDPDPDQSVGTAPTKAVDPRAMAPTALVDTGPLRPQPANPLAPTHHVESASLRAPADPHAATAHVDGASLRPPPVDSSAAEAAGTELDSPPPGLAPTGLLDWSAMGPPPTSPGRAAQVAQTRPGEEARVPTTREGEAARFPITRDGEPSPFPVTRDGEPSPFPVTRPERAPAAARPASKVGWGVVIGVGCVLALMGGAAALTAGWLLVRSSPGDTHAEEPPSQFDPPMPAALPPLPMREDEEWAGTLRCLDSGDQPLLLTINRVHGRRVGAYVEVQSPDRARSWHSSGFYEPGARRLDLRPDVQPPNTPSHPLSGRFDETGERFEGITWDSDCRRFDVSRRARR